MHLTFDIDDAKFATWRSWLFAGDIFGRDYAGYWLYWIGKDDKLDEHLAFEMKEEEPPTKELREEALWIWRHQRASCRKRLREMGFYIIDQQTAIDSFKAGILRKGIDWYSRGDANDADVAVQLALLGEIRYG